MLAEGTVAEAGESPEDEAKEQQSEGTFSLEPDSADIQSAFSDTLVTFDVGHSQLLVQMGKRE